MSIPIKLRVQLTSVHLLYIAYFVTLPVSVHPVTIIETKNTMKRKNKIEAILVCSRVLFFFLRHVYTCSYLSSELPQRERTKTWGKEEEGRMKEEEKKKKEKRGKTHS